MIPLATTLITVTRIDTSTGTVDTPGDYDTGPDYDTDDLIDPYDATQPAPTTVDSNVRAAIGPPTATVELAGGRRVEYDARLVCDPCDLQPGDTVTTANGDSWRLLWARRVTAFGNDHMLGLLRATTGAT